jgi:hypothetical protein
MKRYEYNMRYRMSYDYSEKGVNMWFVLLSNVLV